MSLAKVPSFYSFPKFKKSLDKESPNPHRISVILPGFLYLSSGVHVDECLQDKKLLTPDTKVPIMGILNVTRTNKAGIPNPPKSYKGLFLRIPVDDGEDEDLSQYFGKCYDFIEKCRKEKKPVVVHCFMGISRSSTVILSYLMKKYGMSLEDAWNLVKYERPIIEPNSGFINQLRQYEALLQ